MILAGEYLPANHGASANPGRTSVALPSGGAVLQRVTVLTSQPNDTLVLLRADYSAPAGSTYENLASNSNGPDTQSPRGGSVALPSTLPGQTQNAGTATATFSSELSAYLAPATQYARTQSSNVSTGTAKGATIDVHA